MEDDLPATMVEPDGTVLTRGVRPFVVRFGGQERVVDLPGYYPAGDGEGVHIGADTDPIYHAMAELKALAGIQRKAV